MEEIRNKIYKKSRNAILKKVKEVTSHVFSNFLQSLLYAFYIFLFTSIMSRHIEITETNKSNSAFQNLVNE